MTRRTFFESIRSYQDGAGGAGGHANKKNSLPNPNSILVVDGADNWINMWKDLFEGTFAKCTIATHNSGSRGAILGADAIISMIEENNYNLILLPYLGVFDKPESLQLLLNTVISQRMNPQQVIVCSVDSCKADQADPAKYGFKFFDKVDGKPSELVSSLVERSADDHATPENEIVV